ncbi:unnamed protein product, partial [Hymenolepis diminuta]
KKGSSNGKILIIEYGDCDLDGSIIGSPCEVQEDRTVITFNEVPDYDLLTVENYIHIYTVYFAKDCQFPTPKDGEIIVEKSIPLYRFLGGKTEENVVFAMKGTNNPGITLWREDSRVCGWQDSIPDTDECGTPNCIIIFQRVSGIRFGCRYFNGKLSSSIRWSAKR